MLKFLSGLFNTVGAYFRKLFKKATEFLKNEIPVAVAVVENLKFFIDSPIAPVMWHLIPGEADGILAEKIKKALPVILVDLKIARDCVNLNSNDEIIQCAINHLKTLQPTARYGYWLMIASHLSQALTDNKLSWSEIVTLVQSVKNPEIETSK